MSDFLVAALGAGMGAAFLITWILQTRLLLHLRREHLETWKAMGQPWPWLPTLQPGAASGLIDVLYFNRRFPLPDPTSVQLAVSFRVAFKVFLALFVAMVLVFAGGKWFAT